MPSHQQEIFKAFSNYKDYTTNENGGARRFARTLSGGGGPSAASRQNSGESGNSLHGTVGMFNPTSGNMLQRLLSMAKRAEVVEVSSFSSGSSSSSSCTRKAAQLATLESVGVDVSEMRENRRAAAAGKEDGVKKKDSKLW